MTDRQHTILGVLVAGVILTGIAFLIVSCTSPGPSRTLTFYGERITPETWHRVDRALPLLPADPFPCVLAVELGASCTGTHGCYDPDQHSIRSSQAALPHELGHAAAECSSGDPDYRHTAPWWRDVDGVR